MTSTPQHTFSSRYSDAAFLRRREKNLNYWLARAREIHGTKFDYSSALTEFKSQKSGQVTLKCDHVDHPSFKVTPDQHLRFLKGGGCKICKIEHRSQTRRASSEQVFLDWFKSEKSDQLELVSQFSGMTGPIMVKCLVHGTQKITEPTLLFNGGQYGCDLCGAESGAKARRVTEEDLTFSLPDHVSIQEIFLDERLRESRIRINCDEHGGSVVDKAHLKRSTFVCRECAKLHKGYAGYRLKNIIDGRSPDRGANFGVMQVSVFGIESLKVGISTRQLTARYMWYLKTIFFEACVPEKYAIALEIDIGKQFRLHKDDRIQKFGMRHGKRWGGDTECYWLKQRDAIIEYAQKRLIQYKEKEPDYDAYIDEWIRNDPRDVQREKSRKNMPKKIFSVGVDTGDIVARYESIASAERLSGISGVSSALKTDRRLAGGLRWFTEEEVEAGEHLQPLPPRRYKLRSVLCVETGEVFGSVTEAASAKSTSQPHISSVCKGDRKTAGGFTWRYVAP